MQSAGPAGRIFLVAFLSFTLSSQLDAQSDPNYFYLSGQIGTTSYHGDLTSVNSDKSMFDLGLSGGVGYVLSPKFSLRAEYRRGEYPRTDRPSAEGYFRRHTAGIFATYTIFDNTDIKPYLLGGFGITFYGTYDKGPNEADGSTFFDPAFGPVIGLGFNYLLTDRFSLFLEGKWDFILDDEAMDELSGDTGFDVLGYISAGLKFNLQSTFVPIPGVRLTGPTRLVEGEEGNFTASLLGPASEPVIYEWNFGDGTKGTGSSVRHHYTEPGTYEVIVMASNQRSRDERTVRVTVEQRAIPVKITSIRADDTAPDAEQTIQFSADLEGTEPISIEWDFGDGTKAEQLHTHHTYTQEGNYTVTLRADNTGIAGENGIHTRTIDIAVHKHEPEVLFEFDASVSFALNSHDLRPEAYGELNEAVELLQQHRDITLIEVAGHTCDLGPAEYNKHLSERRARAVAEYLIENGIDESRLVVVGYGQERPKVENVTDENRRQNRRVVLIVKERK